MRYIWLLLIIVFAAGCIETNTGSNTVEATPEPTATPTPVIEATPTPQATEEPRPEPTPKFIITDEEYQKVDTKVLENTIRQETLFLSTTLKRMSIGDTYVFGLSVKNIFGDRTRFRVDAEAVKVEATVAGVGNLIDFEGETLKSWIADEYFAEFRLDPEEYNIISLPITVGELRAPGMDTEDGSYIFRLYAEYYDTDREKWLPYGSDEETLSVKIE